jgi:demethylmenaquinone methyltransferase/2-methoxy-6-polyprenyl-1,4-benzoquinol methylase
VKAYYDRRAPEYDDWIHGVGLYADRHRPGWDEELDALRVALEGLTPARTLDIACGSGFFTRYLPGDVVALDQSPRMIEVARERGAADDYVVADAARLPFADGSFERAFAGHFYGHLQPSEREPFLAEARRVATDLVILDSAVHEGVAPEERQERLLKDGSRWLVYKRYFKPEQLLAELGGGRIVFAGHWFLVVQV